MLLYRLGPEGFFAVADEDGRLRYLHSDPLEVLPGGWELGREVRDEAPVPMVPVKPGKIVGVGRNYRAHAEELGNPMPAEPLLFLKAPSSIVGPRVPVLLPPESGRVEFEGEIAVVIRHRLRRCSAEDARLGILGITAACDVTARDLQRRDATFARGKSFDTFCPLGPAIAVGADVEDLTVTTRVDGEQRQHGHVREMAWGLVELVRYISHFMTLDPGDLVLTGTPEGVGPLATGQQLEVEVSGGDPLDSPIVLENPVEELCS
ncbi:MAG: fumarylacetoacetate hydrolase family protein [Acidobacteriota bacterium]|nr:fumarylacetoacetate hydrolase family protein [Acidobacteriota bacterium]